MARKTPVTTTSKDSGAKHAGRFNSAVISIQSPGEVSDLANTDAQAIKNVQNEIYSYAHKDQDTGVHTSYPTNTGLDTDTN